MSQSLRATLAPIKAMCVVGTRPELIKMAPIIRRMRASPREFETRVVFTGQHRELLSQVALAFEITADGNLDVMSENQSLSILLSRLLMGLDAELATHQPEVVVAQGDTTTVLAAALACHHRNVRFVHVEAGLRTADISAPFPEEANRRLTSMLADLHCAPTEAARAALLAERVPAERVLLCGNTVVDALLDTLTKPLICPISVASDKFLALVTLHRRESFGAPAEGVFSALRTLSARHPDIDFVYPVHPNPNVRGAAAAALSGIDNIRLIEPVDYQGFVALMARSILILTDSGGVQEEAPTLGVPVLVLRSETERPEGVAAGCAVLVGTDPATIVGAADEVLQAWRQRRPRVAPPNPFGDGCATQRILPAIWRLCRQTNFAGERNAA